MDDGLAVAVCTRESCQHEMWDHFLDEDYDNVYFGPCTVDGCDCTSFEAPE